MGKQGPAESPDDAMARDAYAEEAISYNLPSEAGKF
jgi:hypothetical protein